MQLYRSNELRLAYLGTPRRGPFYYLQPWNAAAIQCYLHAEEPTSLLTIGQAPRPGVRYRINSPAAAPVPAATRSGLHIDRGVNNEALDVIAYWQDGNILTMKVLAFI